MTLPATGDAAGAPTGMARVRFLDHRGQRIVLLDFHGITDPAQGFAAAEEARAFIAKLPADGSHFTLTDLRDTRYDREVAAKFRELTAHNRPYVRAAAVVSDSPIQRAAISMIALATRRKLGVFETREEALAYLSAERARAAPTP
ncbi:MAG TPA: STAS/SEC14 domain-containing protein [Gemmatimonadaceae bacterium]